MPKAPLTKEEYLKKYLSKPKGSKQKGDGTVHYITGEMPDSLDAFDERTRLELNMFAPNAADESAALAAATQVRKRQRGALSDEAINDQAEKARKKAELEAKYALWSRGLDTVKEQLVEMENSRYEASKPLARYADDADLNSELKEVIHAEDPMSAYFEKQKAKKEKKKKKKHRGDNDDDEEADERPRYKGPPEPPANRYGIWPGYRWDGVDRSNGFEKKLVDDITRRKVERELAYKWGAEDM